MDVTFDKALIFYNSGKFDNAEDFFRGLALVTNEGHLQYIDTKGKVIWYETKN